MEDDALIAMGERLTLQDSGYEVVAASSGEAAVAAAVAAVASGRRIDLVLMDIDLGEGISGSEAAGRILEIEPVPIVFLTSHAEREMVEKVRGITRYGYVIKNSGDFVLRSSIEMAFELFDSYQAIERSSRALDERNQLLENIIEKFPGSIFWKDRNSVYLGGNSYEAAIAGLSSPGELVGKTDFDLPWKPGEAEAYRATDRKVVETGEPLLRIMETHYQNDGSVIYNDTSKVPLFDGKGAVSGVLGISLDITERMLARGGMDAPPEEGATSFAELFRLEEIQRIQDEFALAMGVASIVTDPDGRPITAASNFTFLCSNIIRKTELGCSNCFTSDAAIGAYHPEGPIVQPCLSGGLWDAGVSITVGGRHVANWLIGQVRNETQSEAAMRAYAREIGADESEFMRAFHEVPAMSRERFERIARFLFSFVNQLSASAYQNLRQAREIAERRRVEAELEGEQRLTRALMDNLPAQIYFKDRDSRFIRVNNGQARLFRLGDPRLAIGKTDFDFFTEEHARQAFADEEEIMRTGRALQKEEKETWAEAPDSWVSTAKLPLRDEGGSVIGTFGISMDITERKRAEDRIGKLLEEKELILKEVHHRIKNNMGTIYSLLSLQAGTMRESAAATALEEAARRVQSMLLLYEKLYESAGFSEIPLGVYLSPLVDEILANFPARASVEVVKRIGGFSVKPAILQPLGIILTELLTNIMKYAFEGRESGRIEVSAELRGATVALGIEDDGVGMPASVDFKSSSGFGLMLVGALTEQLGGSIRIERDKGTRIALDFPI